MPGDAGDGSLSLRHYPFFWSVIEAVGVLEADGSCLMVGLPRAQRVRVGVHHPAVVVASLARAVLGANTPTALVNSRHGRVVHGRVVDVDGNAVVGALVLSGGPLEPSSRPGSTGFLLAPVALLADRCHSVTDPDGWFELAGPDADELTVSVVAAGYAGLQLRIPPGRVGKVHDVVLPREAPALGPALESSTLEPPALRLVAERPIRLVVVRGASRDPARVVVPGHPYVLRLKEPAVLDVTVREAGVERALDGVVVRGPVDVSVGR